MLNVRFDDERRFGMPHQNIGSRGQAFGTRRSQRLLHYPRHPTNQDLHQSNVIEDRHQGSKENDSRQYAEGKRLDQHQRIGGVAIADPVGPKHKPGTLGNIPVNRPKKRFDAGEENPIGIVTIECPVLRLEQNRRQSKLKQQSDRNQPPINAAFVGTHQPRQSDHDEDAQQTDQI